jgi:hypothetical protein
MQIFTKENLQFIIDIGQDAVWNYRIHTCVFYKKSDFLSLAIKEKPT